MIYLDFLAPLCFSFLDVGLPVSFGFHGAGNAWDDAATLGRGQSLLLDFQRFAFPFYNSHLGILLFFGLNTLNTRQEGD